MKILQINNCHFNRGGADIVYLNTGELLESYGNEVFYFSIKNELNKNTKFQKYFVKGIDFLNISLFKKIIYFFRFFYSNESKRKLNKLIRDLKPNIAHVHLYKGGLTPSILGVLKKNKIPVLVTLHDYGFLDPHNLLLDGNLNISEKCITGSSFNCVRDKSNRNSYLLSLVSTFEYIYHTKFFPFDKYFNTIVAVSKFSQVLHLKSNKFNWSIDHLYNFSPLLNRHEETIKQGSNYLLYFGRLSKEKGIKTLINAVEKLDVKIDLKIVGTGVLEIELKKYIQDNNLTNIKLLGFKEGKELHKLIRESKFVIVPSQWYENNPMTIIESYCFGVPVIGSRIGGIPEIIDEGKTGFTYEMGNIDDLVVALTKGINLSEEEYIILKNNARVFAEENFSPSLHYNKLMNLYKKTIEKTRFKDGQK
jgi:glycosyltransferase involved in cell wall biosynthesis